jgi:predicted AAA+ superfamily ATPase
MSEPVYCFSTARDRPFATNLLLYMAQQLKGESCRQLDFVSTTSLGGYSRYDHDLEDGERSFEFELGEGVHPVWYEDSLLSVGVSVSVSDGIKTVMSYERCNLKTVSKQISIAGIKNSEQMSRLLSEASKYVASLLKVEEGKRRRVVNFVFDTESRSFVRLGYLQSRDKSSLFMKENEKDALFGMVGDFLDSMADYERCSVPYKLNLLLHGVPGSGKTSVIKTLASHFSLNMAIIPFSPKLTDDMLAQALTNARKMGCRLIALEDVDCIFEKGRKPNDAAAASLTLSGLLNCMDGILRGSANGLIMLLTANLVSEIDEAVLRTARVDYALEFTHADKFQTQACFKFYSEIFGYDFTDAEWKAFWDGIACHRFTTALLQQFFFRARKDRAAFLDVDKFKSLTLTTGKDAIRGREDKGGFYT